jgi:hypothetical protein
MHGMKPGHGSDADLAFASRLADWLVAVLADADVRLVSAADDEEPVESLRRGDMHGAVRRETPKDGPRAIPTPRSGATQRSSDAGG